MAVVAVVVVTRQAPSWGFTSIPTVLGALVGGASIVLFLRRSVGRDDAIVDLEMFSWPAFTVVILVTATLALSKFVRLNFLPVALQVVRGSRGPGSEIGRAHVCTPVTNAHLVCRLLLAIKKQKAEKHSMCYFDI